MGQQPACFLKHSKTCVTMLQYLLHRLTVSPDYSGQRSQLHKRLFVPTKPRPARLALMHQVSTCLHCISSMVCCQQGLDTGKEGSVYYIHIVAHILCLFQPLLLSSLLCSLQFFCTFQTEECFSGFHRVGRWGKTLPCSPVVLCETRACKSPPLLCLKPNGRRGTARPSHSSRAPGGSRH